MKKFVAVLMSVVFFVALSAGFTADSQKETSVNTAELNTSLPLPEIIDSHEATENGYVGRLTAMEQDLNSFVFANENGTQTLRIFNHPVKYTDKNGETRDITLDIEPASGGDFKTKNNSIVTTFKKKLTEGISLEYNDIDLVLKPKAATDGFTASLNGKTVTYPYGEHTSLEYSLTYTGFKEDIVVKQYTGQTEYKFALLTNGYKVEKIGEGYKVTDGEGNIKANIGEIIIFTADERNNTFGKLRCEEVRQNEEYLLTVVIDGEYLSDPNTAYPIRIDPTLEINYSDNGESAIQDVTINSTGGSDGSSTALRIGKRENYGISRVLMKFPCLASYQGLTGVELIKASVELRDIMCESESLTVNCHLFTGNAWDESTANWSNVNPNSYNSSLLSSATVSYSNGLNQHSNHRYSFDITSAVELWSTNTTAFNKGIILKATDAVENGSSFISKTFASYERSANQPSLSMTYVNPFYSSYAETSALYTSEPIIYSDGYGYEDEDLLLRANCYGYAMKMFSASDDVYGVRYVLSYSAETDSFYYKAYVDYDCEKAFYKQQPGEFADKEDGLTVRYGEESNDVVTITSNNFYYSNNYYYYDGISYSHFGYLLNFNTTAENLQLVYNLVKADMATLGYTVTDANSTALNNPISATRRLCLLLVVQGDYHFYMQNSDGTWSHKPGESPVSNKCLSRDHERVQLTNANIHDHACEGIYSEALMQYFYVNKPTVADFSHNDGMGDECVQTQLWSSGVDQTAGSSADTAAKFNSSYVAKGAIEYAGDVDYFWIKGTVTGIVTLTFFSPISIDISTYDIYGNLLYETTLRGALDTTVSVMSSCVKDEVYFFRIEASDSGTKNAINSYYSISIT